MRIFATHKILLSLALALGVASAAPVAAETLVGLSASGTQLLHFDSAVPGTFVDTAPISGLQAGEVIVGIDTRPRTGALYGVGRVSGATDTLRLYRIDPYTGATVLVGVTPIAGVTAGLRYGVGFNPTVDRLRVVNSGDESARLNPNDGVRSDNTDTDLNPAGLDVSAVAYDRSVDGAALTTLFGISSTSAALVRIGGVDGTPSPNGGIVTTVGPLGIPLDANVDTGLDISPSGTAYLSATSNGVTRLFTVNLASGTALPVGIVGNGATPLRAITVLPPSDSLLALDTDTKQLLHFDSTTPERIDAAVTISGLQGGAGEAVVGVDFRPSSGELYLLTRVNAGATDSMRSYRVDPDTGVATSVGTAVAGFDASANYGVDFNPSADRIRVVNAADDNFRIHPDLGVRSDTPINDTNLTPAGQSIDAVAYRLQSGAIGPSLFGIARNNPDALGPALVLIGGADGNPPSPNFGAISLVRALSVTPSGLGGIGFDVSPTGTGYAVLTDSLNSRSGLYRILFDPVLNSGGAVFVGQVGSGMRSLSGLAAFPGPPQIFADGFE